MSREGIAANSVHPDCPAKRAFEARMEWAEMLGCDIEREQYIEEYSDKITRLGEVAAKVGRHVNDLPLVDTEVPPMGNEWCDFANQCPVYANNKERINGRKD